MAKYVIEIPDNTHWIQWLMEGTKDHHPYMDYKHVEDLTPYTEPDEQEIREKVEQEVWGLAQNIDKFDGNEWLEVFGRIYKSGVLNNYSYSEAKARYDKWKADKEQIRVGDEVGYFGVVDDNGNVCYEGVVIKIDNDTCLVMEKDGSTYQLKKESIRYKTKRHFPQVAELLEKMKEK